MSEPSPIPRISGISDISGQDPMAFAGPLRVAILADAARVPRHAVEAFRAALCLPGIDFAGVFLLARKPPFPSTRWSRLLFDGFDLLENLLGRGRSMPHADKVDIVSALAARPLGQIDASRPAGRLVPDARALARLGEQGLDVLLCCTQAPLDMPPGLVRHGVLGIEIGYGVPAQASWAGAAELAQGSPILLTRLVDYSAPGSQEVYVATDPMNGTSLRRNRIHALAKGGAVLRRRLRSLAAPAGGTASVPRLLDLPERYPRSPRPSASLLMQACRQIGRQLLRNRTDARVDYDLWHLAYAFSDTALPEVPFGRLRYLAPAPGTFWADPFPLIHEGRHYIFFEELVYGGERGRLLAVEVAEDGPAGAPMTVLERDYHLSYPQVFHWEGELYMVPETRNARRVELLRCVGFPSRWEPCRVLLDEVQAVDATLWHQAGQWWMFVNLVLDGGESADELHLFFSDSLFGEWTPHPENPLCADVRCARPAGPLFSSGGETFRPSQDGSFRYGGALWINRIERLDRTGYRERPVGHIAPDWHPDVSRVHTLGRAGRLTVLDCVLEDRGGLDIQRSQAAA